MSNEKQTDELEDIINDLADLVIAIAKAVKKIAKYKKSLQPDKGSDNDGNN